MADTTNFEKMKPALDILYDNISLEEYIELCDDHMDCMYCRIRDQCTKLMRLDDDDEENWNGLKCCDILHMYLTDTKLWD